MKTPSAEHPDWRGRPERSPIAGIRFIVWVALRLGRPVARALLHPIVLYFLVFSPQPRAASRAFLARTLGRPAGVGDLYRHFHCFASTILDRVFFLNDGAEAFAVHVHLNADVEALLAGSEGIVLLGSHLGSFEAIRMLGRKRTARPVNMVMYEANARKLNAVLAAINPSRPQEIIGLGHCDSMLKVEACLERGEMVGLLADRSLGGEKQVLQPFLGAPARFPLGPFRVAAMLRRPIVLMYGLYRGGAHYDIYFELLADPSQGMPEGRTPFLNAAVSRYVERLEHYCRQAPYNWFNFYDFWE